MKRALIWFGLITFLFAPQLTFAADEQIRSFDVLANINRGNDLLITEQISYDFGDLEKHGIYRYIPQHIVVSRRKIDIGLHWLGILRDGVEEIGTASSASGNEIMKIGDPESTIAGAHEYRLNYSVARSIVDTPVGQRFSWNVTGGHWPGPIRASSFTFDGPVAPTDVRCFTGTEGSVEHDCAISSSGSKVSARTTRELNIGEGWTVEMMYPAGTFIPAAKQSIELFPWLHPWMLFTFLFSLIWLIVWYKLGRDPRGRGTIIAEFDPPASLKPYEVNALDRDGGDHRALASTILDFARRKVITLTIMNEGKDYRIERNKTEQKALDTYEANLIKFLFASGDEFRLAGGTMERTQAYQGMRTAIERELVNKDLHVWNVSTARVLAFFAVASSWFAGYYVTSVYFEDAQLWLSVIGLCIGILLAYYMPKRTKNGAIMYEHIQGFKEYIRVAEKDRLAFHEAPARTPERFSMLLPYAVALGVEKEWGSLFKDIALPADQFGSASSMVYASQLSGIAHHINSDMRSLAMASSSSGGGGGSSGGGGGGGGGGSW